MKFIFLLLATLIFTEDIYDYENILTKDPKVSVNFLFDDKTFSSSSNKAFDNYFNTFYETELPLYNGALMSCHIPNKISLSHSTNDLNESSLITNISLNYGYIFLREVSALCFNSFEDKWYYKLCPTRKAVQTLSYNKIDEKTGKEVKEVNYLGFGMNYTNLSSAEVLYINETGDIDAIDILANSKLLAPLVVIKDKMVKIYNNEYRFYLSDINDPKKAFYLQFIYDKSEIENLPKVEKDSKYYMKYGKELNSTHYSVTRLIRLYLSFNTYYLDEPLPHMIHYSSYRFFSADVIAPIDEYRSTYYIDDYNVYCQYCDFSMCLDRDCYMMVYPSELYAKVVDVLEQRMVRVNKKIHLSRNEIIFVVNDNRHISFENIKFSNKERFIISSESRFKNTIKENDSIVFYNSETVYNKRKIFNIEELNIKENKNAFLECKIESVLSNTLLRLTDDCAIDNFPFDKSKYILLSHRREWQKSYSLPKHNKILIKNPNNDDHNIKIDPLPALTLKPEQKTNVTMHITDKDTFQINLSLFSLYEAISSLHIYLTQSESITEDDYEMIINSKSGVLIKQIKNNTNLSFYTNEHMNFFISGTTIDIVLLNSSLYLSSLDNDGLFSTKVKFSLPSYHNKIHFVHFSNEKSNIQLHNIKIFNEIQKQKMINIFIFEKKFLLSENATFVDYFDGGDYCEAQHKNRTVKIVYQCDKKGINDIFISEVKEEVLCEYTYYVKSKLLCNPNVVMDNIIKSSDAKVNCVIKNDLYNHNEEEYFNIKN